MVVADPTLERGGHLRRRRRWAVAGDAPTGGVVEPDGDTVRRARKDHASRWVTVWGSAHDLDGGPFELADLAAAVDPSGEDPQRDRERDDCDGGDEDHRRQDLPSHGGSSR